MQSWPPLPIEAWSDTCATLHRWTQIVGKVKLELSPPLNHSWHVALAVTARGLGTGALAQGGRSFQVDFDLVRHRLLVGCSDGGERSFELERLSVAGFYAKLMQALRELGIDVTIHRRPNEVADATPFDEDEAHASYDAQFVQRYFRVLSETARVLGAFRARFIGKSSPVHYFWGAPDLAVTRFSGRAAPPHPGGIPNLPDRVVREAYSHEVSSCGFWPGAAGLSDAVFYSYAYPEPAGFAQVRVRPDDAFYHTDLREFVLPYARLREAADPDAMLLEFAQSTYDAAADLGGWDRAALERCRRRSA